ncbi:response regulator transcription factor [Aequoribacter sp.]|uniref:response regulator transcription factor n=1 Tax=Aequoribacter sp. TaxID=2847771 RepID=UPI003C46F966
MQRVLIIDDDKIFAETAQRAFEREGFEATFECSADSALTKALTWRPEFVLLDLNLGETSGLTLLPKLIETLGATTKIVILTGYSSIATAVEATRLGARNYLCKPTKLRDIVACFTGKKPSETKIPDQPPSVERVKWEHIQRVLQEHDGNISATARALSMHRRTLQRILAKKPVAR